MNDILLSSNLTARYYFHRSSVDMRKGAHSLYHMIKQSNNFSALNGDYFIFIGATRKSVIVETVTKYSRDTFILNLYKSIKRE